MKKVLWITCLSLALLLGGIIGFLLLKRDAILKSTVASTIAKLYKEDHVILKIGSIKFTGLTEIEALNVSIAPEHRDSLAQVEEIRIGIAFWPLFAGKVKIRTLVINKAWVHAVSHHGKSNYDFLLKKKAKETLQAPPLAQILDRFINQALYKIPDNLEIHSIYFSLVKDSAQYQIQIPSAEIKDHHLNSTFYWSDVTIPWHLTGTLYPSEKTLDLSLFSSKKSLIFPSLKNRYKLDLSFDTLHAALKGEDYSNSNGLDIHLAGGIKNLRIHHPKIGEDTISFPSLNLDGFLNLNKGTLTLDSSSTLQVNKVKAHPYFAYNYTANKEYSLGIRTEMTDAQNFFDALPSGLFQSMQGIKVEGKLAYHLHFHLEKMHPNDLEFEAGFDRDHLKILAFGQENLQKINSPFLYTPYENGIAMRPRMIGPSNPNYAPFSSISPFLRNAVVASEDPNFYAHHGIDEYAFRKVIAIDYKAKSFKRGASTISMQLVKNTFLSREKTISRKAEEMLITWLLENNNLTSKQRILEVYLNLIEWGPNIYGIGEASHFYFGKSPSELSLGESIFLTHIIPRPKAYQYAFNPNGSLKDYIMGYYRFLSGSLLQKGKIIPTDTLSMFQIHVNGPAAKYIIKTPDSTAKPIDSLDFDPYTKPNMDQ